jgi:hypothetical protein
VKLAPDRGEGQHWNLAPGNLLSKPRLVHIGPGAPPIAKSRSTEVIPPIKPEPDTKYIRHIRIQSKLLTKFWGRPVYLSAIVLVPEGFDAHPEAHYPLIVFHDHFVTGFNDFRETPPDPESEARLLRSLSPRRLQPHPAGGGVQELPGVDRARHAAHVDREAAACQSLLRRLVCGELGESGPYGDAIETELIPAIERSFAASARAGRASSTEAPPAAGNRSPCRCSIPSTTTARSWPARTRSTSTPS